MMSKTEKVVLADKHWVKQNSVSTFKADGHGESTHVLKEACSSAVRLSCTKKCCISKMYPVTEAEGKEELTVLSQVTVYYFIRLHMRKTFNLGSQFRVRLKAGLDDLRGLSQL